MSYILIEHDFSIRRPDPPGELMYYDVELRIAVSLIEDERPLPWQTEQRIITRKLQMGCRLWDLEQNDENKEKLLRTKYLEPPEMSTEFCFHSDKVSPVTMVEMSDPCGLLEWLGINLKDTVMKPEGLPPITIKNIPTP